MDLAPYIQELILLNECIILPGFGGFETSYMAAHYDNSNKAIIPPTKKVDFKPEYIKGNGILENHLCAKLGVNPEEARKYIADYVENSWKTLKTERQIKIDGVGNLFYLPGKRFKFRHISERNYLVDSYGLTNLSLVKSTSIPQSDSSELSNNFEEEPIIFQEKPRRLRGIVLFGIVTVIMILIVTILLSNQYNVPVFSLNPKADSTKPEELVVFGTRETDTAIQKLATQIDELTSSKQALYYSDQNSQANADLTYFLVAGSFAKKVYASDLMSDLKAKGYQPKMIYATSHYRVIVGAFKDKKEALAELNRIRNSLDQSIWLMSAR